MANNSSLTPFTALPLYFVLNFALHATHKIQLYESMDICSSLIHHLKTILYQGGLLIMVVMVVSKYVGEKIIGVKV